MLESHPHELRAAIPERLDIVELRHLSTLSPGRALFAIASEWCLIACLIWLACALETWPVTLFAVIMIGARQHALTVIAHDAAHFRLLSNHALNDWVGNLLLAWPMFISVQGFRHYHADHHRYLNREQDGNRVLWATHGPDGQLRAEWQYPKTRRGFAFKLIRRVVMLTGVYWLIRGLVGGFMFGVTPAAHVVRVLMLTLAATLLSVFDGWYGFFWFWVVPYCTWHVVAQYVRLVCEHSAVSASDPRYADTRTTIPSWLGRMLVLPRNIGYHLEHHWYPSVPFYRLPELHARLLQQPGFEAHAQRTHSILRSVAQVLRQPT